MYLFMKSHFYVPNSFKTILLFLISLSINQSTLYGQSAGLYAKLKEVGHICKGSPVTGFIEFELLGPPEEFTYYWSNGEEGLRIENLEPGLYTFFITNSLGCEEEYEVEIIELMECRLVYEITNVGKCQAVVELFVFSGDNELITESLNITWADGNNLKKRTFDIRSPLSICVKVTTKSDIPCCEMETCISVSKNFCQVEEPPNNLNCTLLVNEFGGREDGKRQYVELLVYNEKSCYCDLTNFIIDDNNGEVIKGNQNVNENTKERIGINKGYLAFQNNENWKSVQNGSLILIYDEQDDKGEKGEPTKIEGLDPWDSNRDGVYVLTANDSENFYAKKGVWDYANSKMKYEESLSELPKWSHVIITDYIDGLQTRYPNGEVCHALSHGSNLYSQSVNIQNVIWKNNDTKDCTCAFEGEIFTDTDHFSCRHDASPGKANSEANDKIIKSIKEQCEKEFAGKRSFSPDPSADKTIKENQNRLIVFPNPVTEKLSIKFLADISGIANVSIHSVSGFELHKSTYKAEKGENIMSIDVRDFMIGGVYFIKFKYPSGKQDFVKFIGIDDK